MTKVYYIEPRYIDEAEANGIPFDVLRQRVYHLGWDIEDAVTRPVKIKVSEWAKRAEANGINDKTYHARVNQYGWSPEDASTIPTATREEVMAKARKNKRRVFTDEQLSKAKELGLSAQRIHQRVRSGWSKEDAVSTPLISKNERKPVQNYMRQVITGDWNRQKA